MRAAREALSRQLQPRYEELDLHLDGEEYKNIDRAEAAGLLGHFTHTLPDQGYPWEIRDAQACLQEGNFIKGKPLSDLEVLKGLSSGEPVVMQPMRELQLDLSAEGLTATAAAGRALGTGGAVLEQAAQFSNAVGVSAGSQGVAIPHGEAVVIHNLGELKLLRQLHDSEEEIKGESLASRVAHQFSDFTQKKSHATHWRFYRPNQAKLGRVISDTVRGVVNGGLVGVAIGGALGAVLGVAQGNFQMLARGAVIGAAAGGIKNGLVSARDATKGEPVSCLQAFEDVLQEQTVVFQRSKGRSVSLPLVGKVCWFQDNGKGSSVSGPEDLESLYLMHSDPSTEPEEKKTPEIQFVDNSVHVHHHF